MIRSMTGFAAVAADLPGVALAIELRSVNHRFLDLQLRLPDELRGLETTLRERILEVDAWVRSRPTVTVIEVHPEVSFATMTDFMGGLAKSVVFGVLIAGIGCLRGLQTKAGASAVGDAATRAVVTGIILLVVVDGLFAVAYYLLDI